MRWLFGSIGAVTLAISLLLFVQPQWLMGVWPWMLTPLTARVMGALFALPGLVGLGIASDRRWSAARIILQAQAFSIRLILLAAVWSWGDFNLSSRTPWLFIGCLGGLLIGIIIVYAVMERRRPHA